MYTFKEYLEEDKVKVWNNIHIAHKHAERQGKKVIHTAGKGYKLADHNHPSPALIPNPDRDKQISDAHAELKKHQKTDDEIMQLPYKKRKEHDKHIASIKNRIRDPIRYIEKP